MIQKPATIKVSDLRTDLRTVLENVCFRRHFYVVERSGQPMAVILGMDHYERLVQGARAAGVEPSEDVIALGR